MTPITCLSKVVWAGCDNSALQDTFSIGAAPVVSTHNVPYVALHHGPGLGKSRGWRGDESPGPRVPKPVSVCRLGTYVIPQVNPAILSSTTLCSSGRISSGTNSEAQNKRRRSPYLVAAGKLVDSECFTLWHQPKVPDLAGVTQSCLVERR